MKLILINIGLYGCYGMLFLMLLIGLAIGLKFTLEGIAMGAPKH